MLALELRTRLGDFTLDARMTSRSDTRVFAISGASGAGKSTVLRCIAGLHRPDAGRVAISDRVLLDTDAGIDLPVHHRRVGLVFQDGRLFPHLGVRQNLLYGRPSTPTHSVTLDDVVEVLGIGHLLDRRPSGLSGGEVQRVAIGRALLSQPDLLLMDEPLASIDESRRIDLMDFLVELPKRFDIPIVYVTHNLDMLLRLADEVAILEAGRVVGLGAVTHTIDGSIGQQLGTTVFEGRVAETDQGRTVAVSSHIRWTALGLDRFRMGERVRVRISADDVLLAVGEMPSTSVRNQLPATVVSVEATNRGHLVRLRFDGSDGLHLRSRVSERAVRELSLTPGRRVTALVKAASIRIAGTPHPRWGSRPGSPPQSA